MPIILKGKKVTLRPLSLNDVKNFCEWLDDGEVTTFLTVHEMPKPSIKEEREWITKAKSSKTGVHLAIDAVDGQHIGSISLLNINQYHKNAEFGIMIGHKKYWGRGYGTEAIKLMIDYGFKKLKLHKISLNFIAYNARGQKAYQKVGFKNEGKLRENIYRNGHWHDSILMSILQKEYNKKYG